MSWRKSIPIHPAADLFPLLDQADLVTMGNDIKANGLTSPIAIRVDNDKATLCDGRNRLDAMEIVGLRVNLENTRTAAWKLTAEEELDGKWVGLPIARHSATVTVITGDPAAYIVSANIHRRHLTAEIKRELIAKLLKEHPERSDRATAELVKVDHKTVAAVRRREEDVGSIPHVEKRVDTKGRQQPTRKTTTKPRLTIDDKPATATEVRAAPLTDAKVTKTKSEPEAPPKPAKEPSPIEAVIPPIDACLMAVREMIFDEWLPQIPKEQYEQFLDELHDEIKDIERVIRKKSMHADQIDADHAKAAKADDTPTNGRHRSADLPRERAKAVLRLDSSLTKREVMERAECGSKAAVLARRELEKAGEIALKANAVH